MIATDDQVERGIQLALQRIKAPGVLIEGNSFLRFIDVDFAVVVTRAMIGEAAPRIKGSTRWAFQKASALYVFDQAPNQPSQHIDPLPTRFSLLGLKQTTPTYQSRDLPKLTASINRIRSARTSTRGNQGS